MSSLLFAFIFVVVPSFIFKRVFFFLPRLVSPVFVAHMDEIIVAYCRILIPLLLSKL